MCQNWVANNQFLVTLNCVPCVLPHQSVCSICWPFCKTTAKMNFMGVVMEITSPSCAILCGCHLDAMPGVRRKVFSMQSKVSILSCTGLALQKLQPPCTWAIYCCHWWPLNLLDKAEPFMKILLSISKHISATQINHQPTTLEFLLELIMPFILTIEDNHQSIHASVCCDFPGLQASCF